MQAKGLRAAGGFGYRNPWGVGIEGVVVVVVVVVVAYKWGGGEGSFLVGSAFPFFDYPTPTTRTS
jgi:hypothetical protein